MKKWKKLSFIWSIVMFAICIAAVIGITCAWNPFTDYSGTLNLNWNFSLPSEAHYSEVYSKDSGSDFHGDGIRYHVFSYQEDTPIYEMFKWQPKESKTRYHDCYSDAVNEWLHEIDVPSEEHPNYTACLYWYQSQDDGSEIIILWDRDKGRLYMAESFL